ncbi:MAG: preprotein translocase subunit SecG [Methylophilaceae bacterium]|jgi:preprotein translocase subunit SecG
MENIITVVHVLAAASLIGLILIQHGKGADMGAAFGSGASGSLFGVSGSSNFLSRATSLSVIVFFATSLTLAYIASHRSGASSVIQLPTTAAETSTETPSSEVLGADSVPTKTLPAASTAKDVPN